MLSISHYVSIMMTGMNLLPTIGWAAEQMVLTREDQRPVTVVKYIPQQSCQGVAIISHGAGGSEYGYSYLANFLQQQQWLVLVVDHQESNSEVLKQLLRRQGMIEALTELVTTASAYQGRFMDISMAQAWAKQHCAGSLQVLLGHSMGAATTMLLAGAENNLNVLAPKLSFDAYIALSPQGVGSIFPKDAWRHINKPVLLLTGTKDRELHGSWQSRQDAFYSLPAGCKWLGVINGANHLNFAGKGASGKTERLVTQTVAEFIEGVKQKQCQPLLKLKGLSLRNK
ncbi:MAG TPA: hypothetical protein PK211_08430 [Agitococcus sp.]|nr:hypothetical protein [Agitococcus sp.]